MYWIDFISQDKIFTTHTLQLATKYKEKEYVVHDYSTKVQNPDALVVSFDFGVPGGPSGGGTYWTITLPNGEKKYRFTKFMDSNSKETIISDIKSFMSEYNKRIAAYSGFLYNNANPEEIEGIIEQ